MRNVSDNSCRENQNKHFVFSNFFRKSCRLWENVEKFVERGRPQMTIWLMRIACWIPKAINTLRLCNTHCFSTATMVARTRLDVTLYVHCLFFKHLLMLLATWWNCEVDWIYVVLSYLLSTPPLRIKKKYFPSGAHLWRKFLRATKSVHVVVRVYLKELCTQFHREYLHAWGRTPWKRIKCMKIKLLH
jgi:hypothetical protein